MVEWIKPGMNIDWVGQKRKFFWLSTLACTGAVMVMIVNFFVRGEPVNYGTDFRGGSQIQVEFSKPLEPAQVREALAKAGMKDAAVMKITDSKRPYFFMLRVTEVTAFSAPQQNQVKNELQSRFKQGLVGIDYKPGSDKVYLRFKRDTQVTEKDLVEALKTTKVDFNQVQRFGKPADNVFEAVLSGMDRDIRRIFDAALGAGTVKDVPQIESVGAKMGKELRNAGIKSVVYSLLLIFLYVALRFDFRYGPGGVVCLLHDVLITTGVVALTWTEFSMTAVAALLTLAGYSINDTIVVYDRIRENVTKYRDRKLGQIINTSINETLGRTVLTAFTTGLTTMAMWLLGTGEVKVFCFIFTFGILVGTYSSIAVAAPMTLWINDKIARRAATARS